MRKNEVALMNRFFRLSIMCAVFLSGFIGRTIQADVLYFQSGMRLDVERSWEENGEICVRMFDSVYRYPKTEIVRIEKKGPATKSDPRTDVAQPQQPITPPSPSPSKTDVPVPPHSDPSTRFQDDYAAALKLAREGKWPQALETGARAYRWASDRQRAARGMAALHTRYADHLRKTGLVREARDQLKTALDYLPDDATALKMSAEIDLDFAVDRFGARDYDAAGVFLQRAVRLDPDNPHIYVLYGRIAYARNEYADAQYYWRKAQRINPDLPLVTQYLKRLEQDRQAEKGLDTAENGVFVIKFQGMKKQHVADEAVAILEKARTAVGLGLDLYPDEKIIVIVYPGDDLQRLNYLPDWAAGGYDGKIRFAEDLFEGDYVTAVLVHEYTHAVVHAIGGPQVPLWLQEGLAEYMARPVKPEALSRERRQFLASAAREGRLIPLRALTGLNGTGLSALNRQTIQLVYAQSESFVTYLINQYSTVSVRGLVVAMGKNEDPHRAVSRVLGGDLDDLEQRWRKTVGE